MTSVKSVSLVGHSLLPHNIGPVHGASVRVFRSPGARASNFENNSILSQVLNWRHDFTILFLGGNDINDDCVPSKITNDIVTVVEQIHTHCNSDIALVLIEHRNPPPNNRFNVTATNYNKIANRINNNLKKKYKSNSHVRFLSVGAKPFQFGVTDGVHFNDETKAHLKAKFRNAIQYFIDQTRIQ